MRRTPWLLAIAASFILMGSADKASAQDFFGGGFDPFGGGSSFNPGDLFNGPGAGGLLGSPLTSLLGGGGGNLLGGLLSGNPLAILGGLADPGLISSLLSTSVGQSLLLSLLPQF